MKIVADQNILLVKEIFSQFGEMVVVPASQITAELIKDASILLVRSVTTVNKSLLEGSAVKFVGSATIGVDHIDREYLRENNIGFAHAPGSNADSVAEYVVAALLHLSKTMSLNLASMTIGIIGVGNVGSKVYSKARALGLKCLLNDPPKKRISGSELYLPIDEVLRSADILTIHVPLTSDGEDPTYHMVNNEFISKMKDEAVLINTSRGKIIDEKNLRAFREKIGALVLDVWENEPAINYETLKIADIGTPHIAGYSIDGKFRGSRLLFENLSAFLFKKPDWSHSIDSVIEGANRTIDVSGSPEPVYDAVMESYPIMKDDREFRKVFRQDKENQAALFEKLRKNYPKRIEFTHHTVICSSSQQQDAETLKELGFKITIKTSN